MEKYAVVRTDRIGDVVLSLPVAEAIKESRPEALVSYVVSPKTADIAGACPFVDRIIEYDEGWRSPERFIALVRRLRAFRPDIAVFLRPTLRVAWASLLAGVPVSSQSSWV